MDNQMTIDIINSKELIRDKLILNIDIKFDNLINLIITIQSIDNYPIIIEFLEVKEFSLNCGNDFDSIGILISHYKLFIVDNLVYFSFDPYDENKAVHEDDNNFIMSNILVVRNLI